MWGVLAGSLLSIIGGWIAIRMQAKHNARALAAALLAEIETSIAADKKGAMQQLNRDLLAALKEHGEVGQPKLIKALYDQEITQVAPVYFASLASLGLLPSDLTRSLIQYYATVSSIIKTVVRLVGEDVGLGEEEYKGLTKAIEEAYDRSLDLRDDAVRQLRLMLVLSPSAKHSPLDSNRSLIWMTI